METTTLYVGNIPYSFIERDVSDLFEKYGRINQITMPIDQYTGRNKGFVFVEFEDRREAEDVLDKYNGFVVENRRLKLDWDIGRDKKQVQKEPEYSRERSDRISDRDYSYGRRD